MENLTHSHSTKSYSGNGFGMTTHKSVYDDVFGGPPKFGVPTLAPRFEDYSEIFGGFHSSRGLSIPIIDLPVVDQAELSLDIRRSSFDYSEVFGGFNGLDLALPFQDLVRKSNGGDDSSDDAWSPAQSESLSDESDPSICSERSQSLPNADSHNPLGDVRQFSVSHHKANQIISEKIWKSATPVAQSHAIPGHAYRIIQNHASQNIEDEGPSMQVSGDHNSFSNSVGRIVKERRIKKSISLPKNSGFGMHGSDLCHMERHSRPTFAQNEPFVTVNDISLRTMPSRLPPPSRPPPVFAVKEGDPEKPNPKLRASNSFTSKWTADDSSLPFHDVEIDASSSKMASAIEKAQVKIRSAKESIERKEVIQTRLKLQAEDSIKITEEKISHTANGADNRKDDKMQGTYAIEGIGMQPLAEERKKVLNITEEVSDVIDGEKCIDLSEKPIERKHGKECRSEYQVSHKSGGTFAWRQATECFGVVETGTPLKAVEPVKDENNVLPSIGSDEHRHGTKDATESYDQEEVILQFKEIKEAPKLEEKKTGKENCECGYNLGISEITMESSCQKGCLKKVEVDAVKMKRPKQFGETKKLQNGASKSVENLAKSEWNGAEVEIKQKLRVISERRDPDRVLIDEKANERRARENFRTEECDERLEGAVERVESGKHEIKQEERMKKQEESHEKEEKKTKQQEVCQTIENEDILKNAIEREDHVKKFKGTTEYEKNDNYLKRTFEQEEIERDQKLNCEREESKERLLNEDQFEMCVPQDCEEKLSDGCETGEANVRFTEVWEQGRDKNGLAAAYEEENIEESSRLTSASEESMHGGEGASRHQVLSGQTKGAEQINRDGDDSMGNLDQGIREAIEGENIKLFDGPHKPNDEAHLPWKLDKNLRSLEPTHADISHGKDQKLETESKDSEQEVEVRAADLLVEERSHSFGKHEKHKIQTVDDIKSPSLHYHVIDPNVAGIDISNSHFKREQNVSQMAYDPQNMKVNTDEQGQRGKMMNGVQITSSQEITKDKSTSHQVFREWTENGKKIGAPLSAVLQNRRNTLNPDERCTSQNSERKERNLHEALAPKEQKIEERLQHTMELEKEHLRRIEEEKEREREREKDRMAVNRATLEACDKPYSEARERAERNAVGRATAEVRQRVMAETRDRLEKVSMEARGRSLAEKESMEARLRAERAAVQRATAEARRRAFEKAIAEKASFEVQERVERSVPDKFSFSSRNTEVRQSSSSDLPSQSSGTSNLFQYSYSSTHAGVDGESPQRSKARLERYCRTAERAAKALAEKNMRDLLAQREQAERNRLAETLDAEVKRWSSGKEGNLRALLSTLQYILGPDSGWQPIPLTEVITSAAVKKAYRKATLCVHPDKLQQRGASIQQKYICEEVFDLLKEAWNTFNSEER